MGVLNIHSTNEQSHSVPRIQTQLINSNEKIEFADSNERSAFKRNYLKHIIYRREKFHWKEKLQNSQDIENVINFIYIRL